jgi:predicted AlkP superfamily phosphohydrolase/phosphomutase
MDNYQFKKVLLIGIDGAPIELIEKWRDKLPNIGKLMKLYGPLESIIPPLTPAAWTSMFTGTNPGRHNIFDFFKNNGYKKEIVNRLDLKEKTIWDYLDEKKLRSILLNVPYTYPVKPLNGILVSGTPANISFDDLTYPKPVKKILLSEVPNYKIGVDWQNINNNDDEFLKDLYNVTEDLTNASIMFMKEEWNFFAIVFEDLDRILHFHWRFMDKDHRFHKIDLKKTEKYEKSIEDYFRFLDFCIGKIVENVGKDTLVIIASDHGFGPIEKQVRINNYLEKWGFLKKSGKEKSNWMAKSIPFFYKLGFYKLFKSLPEGLKNVFRKRVVEEEKLPEIDWNETKAWFDSLSCQSIRINLKSREELGIVKKSEYNKLLDSLINKLMGIKDNGKNVVKKVWKASEVYYGDYLKNAPDLILEMEEGYTAQKGFSSNNIEDSKEDRTFKSGDHKRQGFFAISGEGIGENRINANIYDIAPTVLKNFGITPDLDGKSII